MRLGTRWRWASLATLIGALGSACDCGGTRVIATRNDGSLRVITADVVSCDGTRVKLQPIVTGGVPPYSYQWEPAAHVTSPYTLATYADADDTRRYVLTVTDGQGWTASGVTRVIRHAAPVAKLAFDQGAPLTCSGTAVTLDASASASSDESALASYTWSLGDGQAPRPSHETTQTLVPKDGQVVSVTVEDAAGCRATATQKLLVRALPTPRVRFTEGSASVCTGDTVDLDASTSTDADGKPVASYAWDLDGNPATIESTQATSGAYVPSSAPAKLTVTDSFGCQSSLVTAIAVRPRPTARIALAQTKPQICAGDEVILDGSSSTDANGAPVAAYAWDLDGNPKTIESTAAKPPPFPASKAETVTLTVTGADGCQDAAQLRIAPRPLPQLPVVVASGKTDGCVGSVVTLSAAGAVDANGNPVASTSWDLNGDGTPDASGPTAQVTLSKPLVVSVTVTDQQGCSSTGTLPLNPRPLPTIVTTFAAGSAAVCAGDQVDLDASRSHDADGKPVASYAWDLDGNPSTVESTQATTGSFVPTGTPANLTVTDAYGCTASLSTPITVHALPTAVVHFDQGSSAVCDGTVVQVDGLQSHDSTGAPVSQYAWNFDPTSATIDSTAATPPPFATAGGRSIELTVTDTNGCAAQTVTQLTSRALPTPRVSFVTGSSSLCAGATADLDASSSTDADGNPVTSYSWDLDGNPATVESTAATTGSFVPTGAPANLTVTDSYGCQATLSTPISVLPAPTPVIHFDQGSSAVCDGTVVQVDGLSSHDATGAPVVGYAWDFGTDPTAIDSTAASPPPFGTAGGREIRLTVFDTNGCSGKTTTRLTSRALPTPVITVVQGKPDACLGEPVQLSGSASTDADGNPVASWTWSYAEAAGGTFSGATTPAFTPSGNESVLLAVTDSFGCVASTSQALSPRALPIPKLSFVTGTPEMCAGASVQLSAAGSTDAAGNPVASVAWDLDGNGTTDAATVQTAPFVPTQSATAHLTVTDSTGCSAGLSQPLTVDAPPTARIAFDKGGPNVCDGATAALDGSSSADATGAPVTSYDWTLDENGAQASSTLAQPPSFSASGASLAALTVTDSHGCTDTTTVDIAGRALPTARIAVTQPHTAICTGDAVSLSGTGSVDADGNPVTGYAWDLDGNPSTIESTSPSPAPLTITGGRTVTLHVTDRAGCVGTASSTLDPRALPTPNIAFASGRADVCAGGSVSLTSAGSTDADGNPVAQVAWDYDSNGTVDSTSVQTPPFIPAGPETTTLTVTDSDGCSASATQPTDPRGLPTAAIRFVSGGPQLCQGESFSLDGSGSHDIDGNPVSAYAWDLTGNGTTDQTTAQTTLFTPTNSGTVSLTVTDAEGCVGQASQAVAVRPLPNARISFVQGSDLVCPGSTVQLSGTGSVDTNGNAVTAYAWDLDGNPSTIESFAQTPPAFSLSAARTVRLTVSDAQGCRGTASQALGVRALPAVSAGPDVAVCAGDGVHIGGPALSGVAYAWSPTTGLDDPNSSAPLATPAATTTYSVTGIDSFGCEATSSAVVTVNPNPIANAGPDRQVALGGSVSLLGSASGGTGPYSYAWTPAQTVDSPSTPDPRASPATDTSYQLAVTDANQCVGTDSTQVTVLPAMEVAVGPDRLLCLNSGKALPLTGQVTSGVPPFTYQWTSSPACAGCIVSPNALSTTVKPAQDTTFTLTVTDANGTSASGSMNVHVVQQIAVDAGPDRTLARGATTQLGAAGQAGLSYSWTCSTSSCALSNDSSPDPIAQPEGTTAYTVTATDGATCTATDSVLVSMDPRIIATVPTEGYNPWDRSSPLWVIFDADLDPASIPGNVTLLDPSDGSTIFITTSYDAPTRMLMVQPLEKCATSSCTGDHSYWNNRPYLLVLKGGPGGIRTAGPYSVPLYNDFTLEFTASSVGDGVAPQIAYRQPSWGASGVDTTTHVVMTFDEPADPRSVNVSTVWIAGHPGTVTYDPRTWTATLELSAPLAPNTAYVVNVVGVKDGPGNPTNTSWTFTTGAGPDTTPPSVVSSTPTDGATGIDVASSLTVTFSEPIETATLGHLKVLDVAAGIAIGGITTYDEATRTATFEPTSFLEPSHPYALELQGLTDQAGNPLPEYSATFTTASVLLAERFEAPPTGWTLDSPWGLDFDAARAGEFGLSDSPGADYGNSISVSAATPELDVSGRSQVSISLWTRRTLQTDNDQALIETSPDGTSWTAAQTLSGPTGWRPLTVTVPTNGRPNLWVRLRLTSDASGNLDGWFVDDFVVR